VAENSRTRQAIAKVQATRGTYVAPNYATDQNVIIYDLDDGSSDFGHTGGADIADGTTAKGTSYSQQKTHTRSFAVDALSSGDIAVAPVWWTKFLATCGHVVDESGANATATYSGRPSCASLDMDFPQWECIGGGATAFVMSSATGSYEFSWDNSGGVIMPVFTYMGKYGGFKDVDEADYHAPSGQDTTPCATALGSTVTFGGEVHRVWSGSFSFNGDNQVVPNSADVTNGIKTGVDHVALKGADLQLTLTIERVKKSVTDYESYIVGNTVFNDVVIALDGLQVTFGVAQIIDWQPTTNNESGSFDVNMKISSIEWKQV